MTLFEVVLLSNFYIYPAWQWLNKQSFFVPSLCRYMQNQGWRFHITQSIKG
jgi:hypothetical protein